MAVPFMQITPVQVDQRNQMLDTSDLNQSLGNLRVATDQKYDADTNKMIGDALAKNDWESAQAMAAKRGDIQTSLGLRTAKAQEEQTALAREKALAERYAGIAQMWDDKDDPTAQQMLGKLYERDPGVKKAVEQHLPPELHNDPRAISRYFQAVARGYKDPLDTDVKKAQLADLQAKRKEIAINPVTGAPYHKYGELPAYNVGDAGEDAFLKNYATTQAPKNYDQAAEGYVQASDAASNLKVLQALTPYAKVGFQKGVPADVMLTARKLAGSLGLVNSDSVAPTELYKFMAQKGVFEMTKALKPATDLDMKASAQATASMQTDPSTLPVALPVLIRIQERAMELKQAEMESFRRGRPANVKAIMRDINERLPLFDIGTLPAANAAAAAQNANVEGGRNKPFKLTGNSDEEIQKAFDALPSGKGVWFVGPDGKARQKP